MSERDEIWIPLVDEPIGVDRRAAPGRASRDRRARRGPAGDPRVPDVRLHPRRPGARPAARRTRRARLRRHRDLDRGAAARPAAQGGRGPASCAPSPRRSPRIRAYRDEEADRAGRGGPRAVPRVRPQAARLGGRQRNPRSLAESGMVRRRLALLLPLALLAFGSAGAEGPARAPDAVRPRPRGRSRSRRPVAAARDRRRPSPRRRTPPRRQATAFVVSRRRLDRVRAVDHRERDHRWSRRTRPRPRRERRHGAVAVQGRDHRRRRHRSRLGRHRATPARAGTRTGAPSRT